MISYQQSPRFYWSQKLTSLYNCQIQYITLANKYRQMSQNKNTIKDQPNEIVNNLSDLALLLGKYQNQLQAHRQHLTLRNDFNPECLFKYLTLGEEDLSRNHIMYFMQQNNKPMREDESKLLFTVYGYKEKMSYSDFLNYIYPFDADTIKTISTIHCKKYIKNDEQQPSQEVLCIFLLLMLKQVEFLHKFEEFKVQKLPPCSRQSIKKWVKMWKKHAPASTGGISSDTVFNFPELKAILKNLKNLPQRKAQPICRRLSLQKQSFIGIDQLEIWFKPWFKSRQEEVIQIQPAHTLFEDISSSIVESKLD